MVLAQLAHLAVRNGIGQRLPHPVESFPGHAIDGGYLRGSWKREQ